jgi:hypothetical protein
MPLVLTELRKFKVTFVISIFPPEEESTSNINYYTSKYFVVEKMGKIDKQ